ncbi:hypothetical protein NC653_037151 [Populus alba x Populus x berolinensis]|uniref:Uncharacterized protein n=1 Tax=Populus alba x Populus x berolinensis TaxID=444605 RepID=A0AAD6LLT8_9ROSI|nr:hypothetical protein NC653_037151 [Populus alba x Populus x berolinensis]
MSFAAKIPMQAIAAACVGCLLVRQSFFHNNPKNYVDLGGESLDAEDFIRAFEPCRWIIPKYG